MPEATPFPPAQVWQPMTPDIVKCPLGGNIISSWKKITVLFSTNESLLLGRVLSGPNNATRAELQAATACFHSRAQKTCCFSLIHWLPFISVHFGAKEMLPLFLFSSLSFLSITAIWSRGGILSENLRSQLDCKSVSPNLIFCFVWN